MEVAESGDRGKTEYRERESNPQGDKHREILSLLRLPISPSRQGSEGWPRTSGPASRKVLVGVGRLRERRPDSGEPQPDRHRVADSVPVGIDVDNAAIRHLGDELADVSDVLAKRALVT